MTKMTEYEHGVPSWVDMGTHDLPAAIEFYSALFGWTSQDMGEESEHYTVMLKDGSHVAALAHAQDPGPPRWAMYVSVDDVDAVAAKVEPAGGRVIVAPMDVLSAGRMALIADPTGALVAAWQPGDHRGAQLVNEPGSFIWSELATSDLAKAKAFYTAVFGWGWGGSDQYAEVQVGGRTVAGAMPRPEQMPAEIPDHWLVYFGARDTDADTEKATGLGASVLVPPSDIPGGGRFSVLMDPQAAMFGLYKG